MNLYPHQSHERDFFAHVPKRAMYWQTRIGKTLGSTECAKVEPHTRLLVITPYGVCAQWSRHLEREGYNVVKLYDTPNGKALNLLKVSMGVKTAAVVNYHRLPMDAVTYGNKVLSLGDLLQSWGPEKVIIDESHFIVSPSGAWAKQTRNIAWNAPWVRLLSGTPAPNSYGDLWGQLSAIDPQEFGYYFKPFADRFLIRHPLFLTKIEGYRDPEILRALIAKNCSFVRREDVFGPDQWLIHARDVEMPKRAAKLYVKLAREWLIDDPDERLLVDGTHILTRLTRLQQIASGYVVGDDAQERLVHRAKLDAVLGDLSEICASGEKAVVFHRFRWEGAQLEPEIVKLAPCLVINGDVPAGERDRITTQFEQATGPLVALVQTRSGGIGISFAEATYALVLSQSFSFVAEDQARDRIFKPGVPRHVMYYRTLDTVDEFIAEVLANKLSMHLDLTRIDRSDMAFGTYRTKTTHDMNTIPELVRS